MCGQPTPEGLDYCSENCKEHAKTILEGSKAGLKILIPEPLFNGILWSPGSGAMARSNNIEGIKALLLRGFTENQVKLSRLQRFFTDAKIHEYVRIAQKELAQEMKAEDTDA